MCFKARLDWTLPLHRVFVSIEYLFLSLDLSISLNFLIFIAISRKLQILSEQLYYKWFPVKKKANCCSRDFIILRSVTGCMPVLWIITLLLSFVSFSFLSICFQCAKGWILSPTYILVHSTFCWTKWTQLPGGHEGRELEATMVACSLLFSIYDFIWCSRFRSNV